MIGCSPSPPFPPFVRSLFLSVQPSAIEKVDWFPECTTEFPDSDELREWMILGRVDMSIDIEREIITVFI